ncbi:MAG: hypothetical protein ABIT07_13175, partial [Ferruginibacter sp.]
PLTINDQPSTTMEVHKHPHHVTHKKKWGEYLLEFLMLFLAVFLGFVAENFREHSVERHREKQYVTMLLADLRTDSIYFIERTKLFEKKEKQHTLFNNLMTDSAAPSNKQIINGFLPLFYIYDIRVTPGTYNQMKASGSLRYIESEKIIGVLQQYYETMLARANLSIDADKQFYSNIIYPFFLTHVRIQDIDDIADSVRVINPVILNRTPATDQALLNIFGNYGSDQRQIQIRYILPLIEKNKELIRLITENYQLK